MKRYWDVSEPILARLDQTVKSRQHTTDPNGLLVQLSILKVIALVCNAAPLPLISQSGLSRLIDHTAYSEELGLYLGCPWLVRCARRTRSALEHLISNGSIRPIEQNEVVQ